MKQLKFKFDLDSKIAIYVPSTNNVNKSVDNSAQVLEVIKRMSKMFGGATASDAVGGWVANDGEIVVEKVKIIYSFCSTDDLKANFDAILDICNWLKKEMTQEAITLEVNGQVAFV